MHLLRKHDLFFVSFQPSTCPFPFRSGLFVVWARCLWDKKIRGFLIEKVRGMMIDVAGFTFF
jgi:hypothetical protein